MNMKRVLQACLATAFLGLATGVLASPTIELKDGSRIQGEIQGIENGVYIIMSSSAGTVRVPQSNIVRIVYGGGAQAAGSSGASAQDDAMNLEIGQIGKRLAGDPAAMQALMNLQSDPQIEALLDDPVIMKAIQEGDFASLLGNPKIRALENNPQIRQLVNQQAH